MMIINYKEPVIYFVLSVDRCYIVNVDKQCGIELADAYEALQKSFPICIKWYLLLHIFLTLTFQEQYAACVMQKKSRPAATYISLATLNMSSNVKINYN